MIDHAKAAEMKSCCSGFYELPVVSLLLGDNLHPGGAALTRKLAEAALVGREAEVLDVACGRGESARLLASHRGCRVVGIDYSRDNIARANLLTRRAALSEKVSFVNSDAERLPFRDVSFDVVICECSLCVFPYFEAALAEIKRVLRPGGRVAISDVVLNEPVPESLQDLVGHVLCIASARSVDGYREALRVAGFRAVRTRDESQVMTDMINHIEQRISIVENLVAQQKLELPVGLTVPRSKLAEAREFVASGGVGYALIIGKKPRLPA